jgi:hypothetical protein
MGERNGKRQCDRCGDYEWPAMLMNGLCRACQADDRQRSPEPVDWRARALAAEKVVEAARAYCTLAPRFGHVAEPKRFEAMRESLAAYDATARKGGNGDGA